MDKNKAYRILQKEWRKSIVFIKKVLNSFLGYYHSFDVNLVVASGSLEIAMHKISVVLCSGSRLKLKKDETHSEKAGLNRVDFLSEIL